MACFRPRRAYLSLLPDSVTGQRTLSFSTPCVEHTEIFLPCGVCIGCRERVRRDWAMRCMHESSLYPLNCFVTLTFSEAHVPFSLDVRHLQLFMKRLRMYLARGIEPKRASARAGALPVKCDPPAVVVKEKAEGFRLPEVVENCSRSVRFFACGEYGDKYARPHYHVLLFGVDFPDKKYFSGEPGNLLWTSEVLSSCWVVEKGFPGAGESLGFSTVGLLTEQSARYVTGYALKKRLGPGRWREYGVDAETGEVRKPEFVVMSRRPGIGKGWLEKYREEVYRADGSSVSVGRSEVAPPRYYDKVLAKADPVRAEEVAFAKELAARRFQAEHGTRERLRVREDVAIARAKRFSTRRLENA